MKQDLELLVAKAQNGDRGALEDVVRGIQDRIHHMAMRMLANPEDAREATQEILIQIVTRLSTFRGDSAFHTWVYRVAANHLVTARKIISRDPGLSFELFRDDLENGLASDNDVSAEDSIMLDQLRISCTMAMLLCLDLKHRMAYVLGDVLECDHAEAADILQISRDNFRKRLSRARAEVVAFTGRSCGVVNPRAKCSCPRRLPAAIAAGRVAAKNGTRRDRSSARHTDVLTRVRKVEGDLKTLALQTSVPQVDCPQDLGNQIALIVADLPA